MNKQNILLLSPFFYPEMISTGKYNTWLAEELVAQGCRLTVVSSYPVYPDWQPVRTETVLPGMTIKRGGGWLKYPGSALLRRALLELWYACFVLLKYVGLRPKPTCVISIFPPSLFFLLLNMVIPAGAKKVGIVHDLQGVYASRSKGLLGRIVHGAIHAVESKCFSSCDRLIFLSKSMASRAIVEYSLDERKCVVCYPFVALPDEDEGAGQALADLFDDKEINVVYSGALGDKQNPDALIAFFKEVTGRRQNIHCHVFSAGPHFERLRTEYAGVNQITFHDLVASEYVSELYARSDVQLIPQAEGTSEGSLPSKLPNLMAAGVPVFVVCEQGSELADLVCEAQAGGVSHSWDAEDLADEFLNALPKMIEESRGSRFARLQGFVSERFSLKRVVEEINRV